jgi:hypothetical protein
MKVVNINTGIELFVSAECETSNGDAAYRVSKVQGSKMTFLIRKDCVRVIG